MRRVLTAIAVLAVVLSIGCSRQPHPHLGEWEANSYSDTKAFLGDGIFYFLEDGNVQITLGGFVPPLVIEGKYKFDYSKDPVQLDIDPTTDNSLLPIRGIVRFVGDKKEEMRILYSTITRPSNFQEKAASFWLTKKVKK